jgi:hypothetical protein
MPIKVKILATDFTNKTTLINVIDTDGTVLIRRHKLPLYLTEAGDVDHEKNNKAVKELIVFLRERGTANSIDRGA